jgi:hypothetical protein
MVGAIIFLPHCADLITLDIMLPYTYFVKQYFCILDMLFLMLLEGTPIIAHIGGSLQQWWLGRV